MFKVVVSVAKTLVGGGFDKLRYGVANTALVEHNKKIYALEETCLPFQIEVKDDENGGFSLDSLDYVDFDGKLTHAMTAHPKVDTKTGELMAFGYDLIGAQGTNLHYSIIDKDGKL